MMRASIGKAVSAMQAPMNSVALNWLMPGVNRPGTVSRNGVISTASRNGAAMPASRDARGALRLGLEMVEAQREADHEHVEADAELRADIEDVRASPWGRCASLEIGEEQPEQRGAEDDAGDHLADDLGLAEELLAQPADDAAGEDDHRELQEEMDAEVRRRIGLRGIDGRAVRTEHVGQREPGIVQYIEHMASPKHPLARQLCVRRVDSKERGDAGAAQLQSMQRPCIFPAERMFLLRVAHTVVTYLHDNADNIGT